MKPLFTEAEHDRIREAVVTAEQRTAGEIVPYFVEQSARYEVAFWRASGIGALTLLALQLVLVRVYDGWGLSWLYEGWVPVLIALAGGVAGALLARFVVPVRRALAGADHMAEMVHLRALSAFVSEEVFATRDRTGILLFISHFEHRIEVLGDAGINRLVRPEEWVEVVELVRGGIRSGRTADGIVAAIGRCGELLERKGVALRSDDVNELPDGLRTGRPRP